MISLLIALLVLCVVVYCVRLLLPMLGLPDPITKVVLIVVALVALLWALQQLGLVRHLL